MVKTKTPLISSYFKYKNHKCGTVKENCLCKQLKNKNYDWLDSYIKNLLVEMENNENENESDDEIDTCFYCQ